MSKLPILKAENLVKALKKEGFESVRQRGSHLRLKHPDGRVVTIPIHQGQVQDHPYSASLIGSPSSRVYISGS